MFRATKCADTNIAAILRNNAIQEIKSITCEKKVRPAYMVTPPRSKNKNRVRSYHRNPKSTSRCHQKKHAKNPYAASLSCKIALNEPDSSEKVSIFDRGKRQEKSQDDHRQ